MESTHLPILWVVGVLSLGLSARSEKFNTHFQIMPRIRKSINSVSSHLHSFKASLFYWDIFPSIFVDNIFLITTLKHDIKSSGE
jgi:hypothetical protein